MKIVFVVIKFEYNLSMKHIYPNIFWNTQFIFNNIRMN